jgi:hypothetical protein
MSSLNSFIVKDNYFTGRVPSLNVSVHGGLQIFDISANAFSGMIPESIFHLPNLTTLSASVNCLSTVIPTLICESNISNIFLSGLHQSEKCATRESSFNVNFVTLPDCIWTMEAVQKLYLSGNGYCARLQNLYLPSITEFSIG